MVMPQKVLALQRKDDIKGDGKMVRKEILCMKDHFHKAIVQIKPDTLYFQCQPQLWIETSLSGIVAISTNGYYPYLSLMQKFLFDRHRNIYYNIHRRVKYKTKYYL